MTKSSNPLSCSLSDSEAERQLVEWADLQHVCLGVEPLEDGVRMRLPVSFETQLKDLAEREMSCCSFLAISTEATDGDELLVTITSDDSQALPVIFALSGLSAP